ncbi:MAG TPA: SAF domain-containing protein [Acidimicrobiales bacterium]|nr:SAF domain-containing protein [Acidimicrobiales bacterium]
MAETALANRRPSTQRDVDGNGARHLRRRRSLPGGRAVVGGFLVALAAVGTFAAYTGATADTRVPYLVARHDLAAGHRITNADLGALPMDLPAALRSRAFRRPSELVGAMVVGPVSGGELLQSGSVVTGSAAGDQPQISFSIPASRAMGGTLRPGELVDVLATYGTGDTGYTEAVVRGARVTDRSATRGSLADRGDEIITLAVPEPSDTLAVAHAVNAGEVMLVLSGTLGGGATTYRPAPSPTTDTTTG